MKFFLAITALVAFTQTNPLVFEIDVSPGEYPPDLVAAGKTLELRDAPYLSATISQRMNIPPDQVLEIDAKNEKQPNTAMEPPKRRLGFVL
jgi:hypothetical protein